MSEDEWFALDDLDRIAFGLSCTSDARKWLDFLVRTSRSDVVDDIRIRASRVKALLSSGP